MKHWIMKLLQKLPVEDIFEILFSVLETLVKSTNNKLDDSALEIIKIIIRESFYNDKK